MTGPTMPPPCPISDVHDNPHLRRSPSPTAVAIVRHKPRNRRLFWIALRSYQPEALLEAVLTWWWRFPQQPWTLTHANVDGYLVKIVLVYEGRGGNIDDVRRRLETFADKTGHHFSVERLEQRGYPEKLPEMG